MTQQDCLNDPSKWQSESLVDDFTDETIVTAIIVSETGMENGFIHLLCKGSSYFEMKVSAGEYIGEEVIHNNVMYRVDKNDPVEMTMCPTSETYVYYNDKKSPFLQDMMAGKVSVIVKITSYDYGTSTAKFSLNGSTSAIQKVLDACSE